MTDWSAWVGGRHAPATSAGTSWNAKTAPRRFRRMLFGAHENLAKDVKQSGGDADVPAGALIAAASDAAPEPADALAPPPIDIQLLARPARKRDAPRAVGRRRRRIYCGSRAIASLSASKQVASSAPPTVSAIISSVRGTGMAPR